MNILKNNSFSFCVHVKEQEFICKKTIPAHFEIAAKSRIGSYF